MWVINDRPFDPDEIQAFPKQNTAETWSLKSGGGWQHPVHIHLEEFQIISLLDAKGERPTGWWPPGNAVPGEKEKSAGG